MVEATTEVVEPPVQIDYARGYGQLECEQPIYLCKYSLTAMIPKIVASRSVRAPVQDVQQPESLDVNTVLILFSFNECIVNENLRKILIKNFYLICSTCDCTV
jgi:hypothetical protein